MQPQVITMKGSVRIKSCELDLQLPQAQVMAQTTTTSSTTASSTQQQQQQQPSHNNNNTDSDTGRAVDNQYSFV